MILTRLIWINLRSYPVIVDLRSLVSFEQIDNSERLSCKIPASILSIWHNYTPIKPPFKEGGDFKFAWLESPGFRYFCILGCRNGQLNPDVLIRKNQWILITTILFTVLMARMMTSSWIIALIVGASLLSRGRLIAAIGQLSIQNLFMFLMTVWMTFSIHFFKTASKVTFIFSYGVMILLGFYDISAWFLSLIIPFCIVFTYIFKKNIILPTLMQLRYEQKLKRAYSKSGEIPSLGKGNIQRQFGMKLRELLKIGLTRNLSIPNLNERYEAGGLLRPIRIPFSLWLYHRKRWTKLLMASFVLSIFYLGIIIAWIAASYQGGLKDVFAGLSFKFLFSPNWITEWFALWRGPVDTDIILSLLIIVLCAVQSPSSGLTSFWEFAWFILLSIVFMTIGAFVMDIIDASYYMKQSTFYTNSYFLIHWGRSSLIFLWMEPVILSAGILGLFNLFKAVDSRLLKTVR
ncbi:MAG: hypothetical protein HQK54_01775 [Oligoflexales bacterium]|nr:hypothetical protein [Oligoflexales bacterium]